MSGSSTYAPAPFDHEKADIIFRSSDNIDFRVFKLFLSLASPFFETLFNIPQPAEESGAQEVKDGLIVIPVTEDSKTLDALLRFCYPCTLAEDPKIEVLKDAMDVLEAARKYSLDIIEKKARQAIVNPKILEVEPLRCFAIAHRGRLREETLLAAKYTLMLPLIPPWCQEIELITATDLLCLLIYHRQCGEAVYALRLDLSWIKSHYKSSQACPWLSAEHKEQGHYGSGFGRANNDGCREHKAPRYTVFNGNSPQWWEEFMEDTFAALREKPCKETVQDSVEKTVQAIRAWNCSTCSPRIANITSGVCEFAVLLTWKVEEIVTKVKLPLTF